jgi:hypothetical protein
LNTAGFFGFYITLAVLAGLHLLDYMLRATRAGSAGPLGSASLGHVSPS